VKTSLSAIIMAALCASLGTPALAAPTTKSVTLTAPPAPAVIKSKPAPVVAVPVKKVTPPPVVAVPVKKATPAPAPAKPRVLRLPSQAGKVSQVIPTKLVAKSPSWIVKGHKHYSLCSPSRHMVACAPIAPTALMKDIEVGSRIGPKGEQFLTFKIAPGTKVEPKRLRYTVAHFLARTRKQVKHFNRMEVSYAPRPGQMSVRVGATANAIDDRGGGSVTCSYDDEGGYDCVGGAYESGSEGGGGGGEENYDPIPATPATNDCQFNCEYPGGNDNGDGDPCLNSAGENICQVVVITEQRPEQEEETETVGCRPINAFTIECGGRGGLPVIGGEPQQLPGRTPWFPQAMCNVGTIFCSAGQVPDNDRGGNSSTSGKSKTELYEVCEQIEEVERDVCYAHKGGMDYRSLQVCLDKARDRKLTCYQTARELTENGTRLAP
jgi:hypothetical protein